jgi:hypothetical protein
MGLGVTALLPYLQTLFLYFLAIATFPEYKEERRTPNEYGLQKKAPASSS